MQCSALVDMVKVQSQGGLDDLRALFQPLWFCDSEIIQHQLNSITEGASHSASNPFKGATV